MSYFIIPKLPEFLGGLVTFASLTVGSLGPFPLMNLSLERLLELPVRIFVKQRESLSLHPLS